MNPETGHKLLLTIAFIFGLPLIRAGGGGGAFLDGPASERAGHVLDPARNEPGDRGARLSGAPLHLVRRSEAAHHGIGIFGAGLAFALQRVVTALAGYQAILRGNTFTIGDRITIGGCGGT